ncbi:peptide ABC transporter substrate-binding protein [Roseobacter sp. YSTF-M11]|uniref:Peptide ABC transporter substrate-binding protein n=1 Tax=Roseobacter insulae TaxID=2859783 RepID=A0A9X1FSN3_9RHOB|nr:ABC transporter substrate-binding protein [Roseobacter insulae]MBW4706757.1 peptide ABC transporter substrate-binding protein [Roseobacter insulae]
MSRTRAHMDRRALFASGAAAALLAATGVSAQSAPVRGGRLRIALSGAARTDGFDARVPQGLFMQVAMVGAVFETLTEVAADGTLRGELATRWHGSADAQDWVFDLRGNVRFHNGASFSAADVVESFELHRAGALADIETIAATSDNQVRISLSHPDADFPYRLTAPELVVYPARDMALAMRAGIGTGLYRVHRFQPGRQFVGHRVETHYKDGQAGWFDSVELVSLPADAVRAEALREHYVDAADLTHAVDLGDLTEMVLLPEENFMTSAVSTSMALPGQIGARWPLDNLRAAERWWIA